MPIPAEHQKIVDSLNETANQIKVNTGLPHVIILAIGEDVSFISTGDGSTTATHAKEIGEVLIQYGRELRVRKPTPRT